METASVYCVESDVELVIGSSLVAILSNLTLYLSAYSALFLRRCWSVIPLHLDEDGWYLEGSSSICLYWSRWLYSCGQLGYRRQAH